MATNRETLAELIYGYMEQAKREATGETFWRVRDGAPEWITELIQAAHDDCRMPPDDWRYAFTVDALSYLAEGNDPDEHVAEADVYSRDRLTWLASHLERPGYVDEACEEFGTDANLPLLDRIGIGQAAERDEVFRGVCMFIDEELESLGITPDDDYDPMSDEQAEARERCAGL